MFGMLRDQDFIRGNTPMTKEEVRAVVMAKGQLNKDSVVIDIGAGTGSISIQASLIAIDGKVFSIEKEDEAVELIKQNKKKFKVENIEIIHDAAPRALHNLPKADVVIIGGSAGEIEQIITKSDKILKTLGRIIVTSVTLTTLTQAIKALENLGYDLDICQLAVSKYNYINQHLMAKAHNPIFIITGIKGGDNFDEIIRHRRRTR